MTKKNILAISLVAGVAAIALSAGTLAYFTDTTDTKHNVFTVGKVDIELSEPEEADWGTNKDGTAKTVLMPGGEYDKTPTITVQPKSQDAYLVAELTFDHARDYVQAVSTYAQTAGVATPSDAIALIGQFVGGFDADKWEILGVNYNGTDNTISFYAAYKEKASANDTVEIFNKIKLPTDITEEAFSANFTDTNSSVDVKAYAIQAQGFDGYQAAADALLAQAEIVPMIDMRVRGE